MTKKTRSEFSKKTIANLAKRAAYHCSNCQISTLSASESDDEGYSHTGQAAHIISASLKGPRADTSVSIIEKSNIRNGIYLCQICAKIIDANRGTDYSLKRLQQIKNDHAKLTRTGTIPMSPEQFTKIVGVSNSKITPDKPDLALRFIYSESPALVLINQSPVVAKDIKWTVAVWNMDLPERNDPLPIPVSTFDFIRPNNESGPQNLFDTLTVKPLLKPGDRLFGSASVCSPGCIQGRTYVIYIVWGKSGWFAEVREEKSGNILIPKNFSKAYRDLYFKTLERKISIPSRIPIGTARCKINYAIFTHPTANLRP